MTDALGNAPSTDSYREALAERFGEDLVPLEEVATGEGRRADVVAALNSLAAWVAVNISLPAPTAAHLFVEVPDIGQLLDIAAAQGADVSYNPQGDPLPIVIAVSAPGQPIYMRVFASVRRPL